jgi:hypothetical protein
MPSRIFTNSITCVCSYHINLDLLHYTGSLFFFLHCLELVIYNVITSIPLVSPSEPSIVKVSESFQPIVSLLSVQLKNAQASPATIVCQQTAITIQDLVKRRQKLKQDQQRFKLTAQPLFSVDQNPLIYSSAQQICHKPKILNTNSKSFTDLIKSSW